MDLVATIALGIGSGISSDFFPEAKAMLAMEAIIRRKSLQEIAGDHVSHPIRVSQWKKQLSEAGSDAVDAGRLHTRGGFRALRALIEERRMPKGAAVELCVFRSGRRACRNRPRRR